MKNITSSNSFEKLYDLQIQCPDLSPIIKAMVAGNFNCLKSYLGAFPLDVQDAVIAASTPEGTLPAFLERYGDYKGANPMENAWFRSLLKREYYYDQLVAYTMDAVNQESPYRHAIAGSFLLVRAAWDWRYIDQLTPELALFLIRYYSKSCLKLLVDYLPITPLYSQVWRKYVRRMTLIGFEDVLKQSRHAGEAIDYFGL